MRLRDYQISQVNKLLRQLINNQCAALVSAVGTGKTLVATIVANELIKLKKVSKVIVVAPFNTIVSEFPKYSGAKIFSKNNKQYQIGNIQKCPDVKTITDVISGHSSEFISTTHQAMATQAVKDHVDNASDLSDLCLVVDEAHHCFESDDEENKEGTILGEIINTIKNKGGKILYATATPYRVIRQRTTVIFDSKECSPVIRTIGEQMIDGYAPRLEVEYVHMKSMEMVDGEIFGDLNKSSISNHQMRSIIPTITSSWISDGCPKAILLVPAGRANKTAKQVKKYLDSVELPKEIADIRGRKNPSVLISVGRKDITTKDGASSKLELDKDEHGRKYDIVIGCRRFNEGTDVPSASHMYTIGLPSNVRLFHQRVGRVLRNKNDVIGYAEWFGAQWIDTAKTVMFAPVGGKIKNFDYKTGRQLLHCIFVGEMYSDYCNMVSASQRIRSEFDNRLQRTRKTKREMLESKIQKASEVLGDIEIKALSNYHSDAFDNLISSELNPDETVGDRLELIRNSDETLENKAAAYMRILDNLPEDTKDNINWERICTSMTVGKTFNISPGHVSNVLENVLEEYCDAMITSEVNLNVQKVFSEITGESIFYFSNRCSFHRNKVEWLLIINQICDKIIKKGSRLSLVSEDEDEVFLENKRRMLMSIKRKRPLMFFQEYEDLAIKNNIPDLFSLSKNRGKVSDRLIRACEIMKNKKTSLSVKLYCSEEERTLCHLIDSLKRSRYGSKKSTKWEDEYQEIVEDMGFPCLFLKTSDMVYFFNRVFSFIRTEDRSPSIDSHDRYERNLAKFIVNILSSGTVEGKKSRCYSLFLKSYDESDVLIEGMHKSNKKIHKTKKPRGSHLLKVNARRISNRVIRIRELVIFLEKEGRIPRYSKNNEEESKMRKLYDSLVFELDNNCIKNEYFEEIKGSFFFKREDVSESRTTNTKQRIKSKTVMAQVHSFHSHP